MFISRVIPLCRDGRSQLNELWNACVWIPTTTLYWSDSANAFGMVDTPDVSRFWRNPYNGPCHSASLTFPPKGCDFPKINENDKPGNAGDTNVTSDSWGWVHYSIICLSFDSAGRAVYFYRDILIRHLLEKTCLISTLSLWALFRTRLVGDLFSYFDKEFVNE